MSKYTRPCPDCGAETKSSIKEGPDDGGGWWWCTPCDKETLPSWNGFYMYDTVEVVGAKWPDGSKVTGAVKGGKGDKVGVSTDSFWGFFEPEKLKLIRRLKDGKWIDG